MGLSSSKDDIQLVLKNEKSNVYRPPDVRIKDRYDVSGGFSEFQFEPDVEKYDYAIAFKLSEGPVYKLDDLTEEVHITWAAAVKLFGECIPGTEGPSTEKAKNALASSWERRTRTYPKSSDHISRGVWLTVVREAILTIIETSGLQLKITHSNTQIYCRLRAPAKLLEVQADLIDYPLQYRPEIDPGSESFWNRQIERVIDGEEDDDGNPLTDFIAVEIEDEAVLYEQEEAEIILEKLYKARKIPASELGIFEDEKMDIWSRRVHALERIADQVAVNNRFPAYGAFQVAPHKRYLFQTYSRVRGPTVFCPKDRILLVRAVLNRYFDFEKLDHNDLIEYITPLHDAERGEVLTIDLLYKKWVSLYNSRRNYF